jgi:hypothetical protein
MITLATLETATAQEVFDQIATHLLTQKARSIEARSNLEKDVCAYRGNGGLKCAAGCLISDEEAELLKLADEKINTLPWSCLITRGVATDKHYSLISALQAIHDHEHFVPEEDWVFELKKLAEQRKLNSEVLGQFKNK